MDETVKIADILVGDRLRKDYGDLSDLNTIETVGLIQPLVLDKDYRRFSTCRWWTSNC